MEKYIREIDGIKYVGVVISPDFGAGWSTWNPAINPCDGAFIKFLLDIGAVYKGTDEDEEWVIRADIDEISDYWCHKRGYKKLYYGGADCLEIHWVEEGKIIRITEYDGAESIEYLESADFFTV